MKNRRLLLEDGEDQPTWRIVEEPVPDPPRDGVVVKVLYTGICHSDVGMSEKNCIPNFIFPRVFGHEISGEVHSVGSGLAGGGSDYKSGDRVIVYPWGNCAECPSCLRDVPYCYHMSPPTGTGSEDSYVYGVWRDGGYQQYLVVHKPSLLIRVPSGLPLDVAALVPCSGITALNACTNLRSTVDRAINLTGRAVVAVVGAGGLALWAIQILKVFYPETLTVVAIDIEDVKLTDAKDHGADKTFKWAPSDTVQAVVSSFIKEHSGMLLDGAIDFTGLPDCQRNTYALLNPGGTLVMVGLTTADSPPLPIVSTVLRNIRIQVVINGSRAQCRELFNLLTSKKVRPPPITAVTLDDVERTIIQMRENKARGRSVVKMC